MVSDFYYVRDGEEEESVLILVLVEYGLWFLDEKRDDTLISVS